MRQRPRVSLPGPSRNPLREWTPPYHALASVVAGVAANSPLPANTACDYYTILWSVFHPGQGNAWSKPSSNPANLRRARTS